MKRVLLIMCLFVAFAAAAQNTHPLRGKTQTTQCQYICKDGHRCKRMTKNQSGYCTQHEKIIAKQDSLKLKTKKGGAK
jgi:hypothetical protein